MRSDIVPGAVFPDYELADHHGKHRALSELQHTDLQRLLVLRPTVEEPRLDLRTVLQRCRPDWDISSTEERTAWANGDKGRFYPYGKTQAQLLAEPD